ncbi:hypothetical protein [Castellaniella sp. S9]|uniref:hypothetical protein n=1 Tax=Castellaniella sp. S9 TaxID=2993652 RepID=UPI0022B531B2|nr:hypothetical protein [Castellaniella sp. S9]
MARNALISEKRLQTIESRQLELRWGSEYRPAMLATRDEAPTKSRPSTMYSKKLGRDLHFMSQPERHVCLLGLYNPNVFDIHEQHMLHTLEAPHPLAGRGDTKLMALRPFKGTIDVAERLNILSKHPVIWLKTDEGDSVRLPFPYLGDLLLFLNDDRGPYCVNWSVKPTHESFIDRKVPPTRTAVTGAFHTNGQPLALRHHLEKLYFSDAEITTHFVASESLDTQVISNLQTLYLRAQRPTALSSIVRERVISRVQKIIDTPETLLSLLPSLTKELQCSREGCLTAFYQAIWFRQLRIDLHRPILPDKPLNPERSDVLLDYSYLFVR